MPVEMETGWRRFLGAWHKKRQYGFVVLVALLGAALSIAAFQQVGTVETERLRNKFSQDSLDRVLALEKSVDIHIEVLRSVGSLFNASQQVEREGFRAFVARGLARYSGIQALEWIPRIPASQKAAYEVAAQQNGFPDFQIVERESQGTMVPAGARDEYFPVYYVEPYEGNEAALGFDLASNPTRLEALNQARDTGQTVATSRITLVQEEQQEFGFLIFQPLYPTGSPVETVAQRRENLTGFALGVFRVKDIVESSWPGEKPLAGANRPEMRLYDNSAPPEARLLFPLSATQGNEGDPTGLQFRDTFQVAGRTWEVVLSSPSQQAVWTMWQPWAALAAGLLFTGLSSTYLLAGLRRTAGVERLVTRRTHELSLSNQRLEKEIGERRRAEEELHQANLNLENLNQTLEVRVSQRTQELEEANAELVKAQDQLVRSEKLAAIGELAGGVAHDLRSPLGAISNACFYLRKRWSANEIAPSNPKVGLFLQVIHDEVHHSNQIITDLLGFARVESLNLAPVSLPGVIEEALGTIQAKDNVEIVKEFDSETPQVIADDEQLRRLVINLVWNAQDAMPEGGKLALSVKQHAGTIELVFSDSGVGIREEDLPKIFDPLYTTKTKGTGLGLAICQQIVSRHGGTISVASQPEEGATFTVRLPLQPAEV